MAIILRSLGLAPAALISFGMSAQFSAAVPIVTPSELAVLRSADLDGDNDIDLLGVFGGGQVKRFTNSDGTGAYGAAQQVLEIEGNCHILELADVDDDLDTDLLYVSDASPNVVILHNDGTGNFIAAGELILADLPGALEVADVSGDGHADVIISMNYVEGAGIGLFLGSSAGLGNMIDVPGLHAGPPSSHLAVGDMDLAGGLDLVLSAANDTLVLVRNTAGNGLEWDAAPLVIPAAPLTYGYREPQLLDIDADGDLDIGEIRSSATHWLRNELDEGGVVTFAENVVEPWTTSGLGAFGRTTCSAGACFVFVPNNPSLPVRWNSFLPALGGFAYSNNVPSLPRGRLLLLADINGDDRDDAVMEVDNTLSWFPNEVAVEGPALELPVLDTLCLSGVPVPLPTASPAGGRWYGQQVFDGLLFRGNLPGTMDLPVLHAVYPEGGCPIGGGTSVRVIQGPVITTTVPPIVCSADEPIQLASEPASAQWFGLDGGSIIDPATWNGGFIVCQYTDATGQFCTDVEGPIQRWASLPAELAELDSLCTTDPVTMIDVVAAPPFNVFWSGPVLNANASGAEFDPSIGPGSYTIVLNAEPSSPNQCRNTDTLVVVVSQTPAISFDPFPVHCAFGDPIELAGASPAGGVWSGNGISSGRLDPNAVGEGDHLLNYWVRSEAGCSAQASSFITLAASTTVEWTAADLLQCPGEDPVAFTASPAGGTWSGPVDENGTFVPDGLPPGEYPVAYNYQDPRGCLLSNAPLQVSLGSAAAVSIDEVGILCLDGGSFALNGSATGVWSGALAGEGSSIIVDPAALGVGIWPLTLTVTPADGCPGEATTELVVEVCTGIEAANVPGLSAFPMPFSERTTVHTGDALVERMELFDATGKWIRQIPLGQGATGPVEIDLGGMSDGVYLLRVFSRSGASEMRLLKVR